MIELLVSLLILVLIFGLVLISILVGGLPFRPLVLR